MVTTNPVHGEMKNSMNGAVFALEGALIAAPHGGVNVGEVADTASVCFVRGAPPIPNALA